MHRAPQVAERPGQHPLPHPTLLAGHLFSAKEKRPARGGLSGFPSASSPHAVIKSMTRMIATALFVIWVRSGRERLRELHILQRCHLPGWLTQRAGKDPAKSEAAGAKPCPK
jgi:hypothetical protein